MKKQKICVIGDGLSGLTAALALSNLDIEVDFIIKNIQEKDLITLRPNSGISAIFWKKIIGKRARKNC